MCSHQTISGLKNKNVHDWTNIKNQQTFFQNLQSRLHLKSFEDWYKVKTSEIIQNGGKELLNHFDGSPSAALQAVYPEYPWKLWLFDKVPQGYWHSKAHQKQFFDWLATQLNITKPADWYKVTIKEIHNRGGCGLLIQYNNSTSSVIKTVYPEYPWKMWLFNQVPKGYWDDINVQRHFFDWLGEQLNITTPESWYKVTQSDIHKYGGGGLLSGYYNDSPSAALQAVYPEYPWKMWLFGNVPQGYWKNMEHQKQYFDWLGKQLNINKPEDWYKVTQKDIINNGGYSLLHQYKKSFTAAIATVYPEYPWKVWLFTYVPRGFWEDSANQRSYFDWLGKQLQIKEFSDWYKVKVDDIMKQGGRYLLETCFNNSLIAALQAVYPEHPWKVWLFDTVPRNYWSDIVHQRQFLDWLGAQLHIKRYEDWYTVRSEDFYSTGGSQLIKLYGSHFAALMTVYPQYDWRFERSKLAFKGKAENYLHHLLQKIFPLHTVIHIKYRHSELVYPGSGPFTPMELDAFIPNYNVAFEYQGEQHYQNIKSTTFASRPLEEQQHCDSEKKKQCEQKGITLIEVPFWWDRQMSSLVQQIKSVRPDIPVNMSMLTENEEEK